MKLTSKQYLLPYILITSLFFLWGFARAILDVLNFACEAIMFPTIFSLSLTGLDAQQKKRASSYMMMTPVGGCAFLLMGIIADNTSLVLPFFVPLAGFLVVLAFATYKMRKRD